MAGAGEPVQLIVAEALWASSIRQTRPIAHGVIDVVGLVDRAAGCRQLMQDIRHLARRIVGIYSIDTGGRY